MSTELRLAAFEAPRDSVRIYRLLRQILRDVFQSRTAFSPPPKIDFSLDQQEGAPIADVLAEVRSKVVAHAINSRHVWTLAHMVPPPATISVFADLLIGAMNQCAFIWEEAPLAATLEAEVIRWVADRIGFGSRATGLLTSGGTMSNCLATYLALERAKACLRQYGNQYCIIASDQAHLSIEKAAALNGLGSNAVIRVATDSQGRLRPGQINEAATQARDAGRIPFLVVCTAATTNAGSLEPIVDILAAAREHQAWCHIDAAHGGFMCLSKNPDPTVRRWRTADSVSWDPHKSLYVSYAVGTLLVQDETMLAPLEFHSEYALKSDGASDAGARHLEGSRRFEALKLWMTIKYFGTAGFAYVVDYTLFLAKELAARIRSADDFILVTEPDTNIVCFRFVDPNLSEAMLNKVNVAVQKELFRNGGPLISSTRIGANIVLRVVLLNPRVEPRDLDGMLECIRSEAHRQVCLVSRTKIREEFGHEDIAGYQSPS